MKRREDRRVRPSKDREERDEMELSCNAILVSCGQEEKKMRWKRSVDRRAKYVREEKQLSGIEVSSLPSI